MANPDKFQLITFDMHPDSGEAIYRSYVKKLLINSMLYRDKVDFNGKLELFKI